MVTKSCTGVFTEEALTEIRDFERQLAAWLVHICRLNRYYRYLHIRI